MLIGYARVSKADGSQSLDLQHDALRAAGVERCHERCNSDPHPTPEIRSR
ncbi:recombinase family protein, partial [Escherichia coli]|nr:recombinase family protein [Escherichia coli]